MQKFTNPLDSVKIASPCPADWNEMYGNERKRFCAECKLNVYNLSDMTRREAENFLINAEGRVCVKFYRRADGTVLTKDCPVGWQAVKKRVSRTAKAFVSLCAGLFGGLLAFAQLQPKQNAASENSINVSAIDSNIPPKKIEDFKTVSIPSLPNDELVSDEYEHYQGRGTVGQLVMTPPEKIIKKETNSKKIRRR
jgi:hypothetical protein